MEPRPLDYTEAPSKLLGMVGQEVEVTVRGVGRKPPLFIDFAGVLRHGHEVPSGELAGWDPDAVQLSIGSVQVTPQPDQFADAVFTANPDGGWRKLVFGGVEVDFHQ